MTSIFRCRRRQNTLIVIPVHSGAQLLAAICMSCGSDARSGSQSRHLEDISIAGKDVRPIGPNHFRKVFRKSNTGEASPRSSTSSRAESTVIEKRDKCSGRSISLFVRYRKVKTKAGEVFNLSLQRSYRDPARLGQVRSETIAGLGSIPAKPHPTEASLFWFKLDAKLAALSLAPEEEQKIRSSINSQIERPAVPLPQLVRLR